MSGPSSGGRVTVGGADTLPDIVSQAEAEAGTSTTGRIWTAERVKQAIQALGNGGGLQHDRGGTLTISAGVITPTHAFHTVDTEGGAAADDIDTIDGTNAKAGDVLLFQQVDDARDPRFMNGTGNIITRSGVNLTLNNVGQRVEVHYDGQYWMADKYTG